MLPSAMQMMVPYNNLVPVQQGIQFVPNQLTDQLTNLQVHLESLSYKDF